MRWASVEIGDLVADGIADIQTGPFGTQLKASDYIEDGVPVINVRNIGYSELRPEKIEFISDSKSEKLSVHKLEKSDIVFGRKGAVDRHLFVQESQMGWVQGSDCIRLRIDSSDVNPRFISYSFLSSYHKQWMLNQCGNKATMASLNQDVVKRIKLKLPSKTHQDIIVDMLACYDDLIENNKRRIELLEESARQLYKEWFVRFRFPGHEHVKIIDGVPDGWKNSTFDEISDTVGGGTPSTKVPDYWDSGDVVWFVPKDLTRNISLVVLDSEKKITARGLEKSSAKLLPPNAIMMSSRASIGYFGLYDGIASTNQGFISVIPKREVTQMYLLHNLMSRKQEIIGLASGTTYKEISKSTFRRMEVLMPADALLEEFQEFASDTISQVRVLKKQILNLSNGRDILLPKLMNGEIAV